MDLTFSVNLESFLKFGQNMSNVTVVKYMYRDGANYKLSGKAVIYGVVKPEVFAKLDAHLFEGDGILPRQLGFLELCPAPGDASYDEEFDHDIHEITEVFWASSKGLITADLQTTAAEFIKAVDELEQGGWDFLNFANGSE